MLLDFWVKPKPNTYRNAAVDAYLYAASNEGSPQAVELHGDKPKDVFQLELSGEGQKSVNCSHCRSNP